MLEAAMFPQKYDGRGLSPEMNQSCGEGRGGGELRVHTEEAPWVGGGLAWPHLARRGERRGGVWRETVVGHCVREVEFFASLTVASLLCYGVLVGKSVEWKLEVRTEETNRTR